MVGAFALTSLGLLVLSLAGSAIVIDETGGVMSAAIVSGGEEQSLYRLWPGYFYAIPRLEGVIEIRCTEGARKRRGYVTGHMHTRLRVIGNSPCAQVIEDV